MVPGCVPGPALIVLTPIHRDAAPRHIDLVDINRHKGNQCFRPSFSLDLEHLVGTEIEQVYHLAQHHAFTVDNRKADQVRLGRAEGVVVSVPAGEGAKLKSEVVRPDPLVAPLVKGQPVGTLRVTTSSGATVAEIPLTVLETVEESGVFGRAWDAIRLWIQ